MEQIPTKKIVSDFLIETLKGEKAIEVTEDNLKDDLTSLGIDSFGFLEVIFAVEHEFNIKFPQEFGDIKTLEDCLNVTHQLIVEQNNNASVA